MAENNLNGSSTSVPSGGSGPDAYIGSNEGPVFQVVNPGPASGVAIAEPNQPQTTILKQYQYPLPTGKVIITVGANEEEARGLAEQQFNRIRANQMNNPVGGDTSFVNLTTDDIGVPTEKPASAVHYINRDLDVPVGTKITQNVKSTTNDLFNQGYDVVDGVITKVPTAQQKTIAKLNKQVTIDVLKHHLGLKQIGDARSEAVDINDDGKIDLSDVLALQKQIRDPQKYKIDPAKYASIIKAYNDDAANLDTVEINEDGSINANYTDAQGQTKSLSGADFKALAEQYKIDNVPEAIIETNTPENLTLLREFQPEQKEAAKPTEQPENTLKDPDLPDEGLDMIGEEEPSFVKEGINFVDHNGQKVPEAGLDVLKMVVRLKDPDMRYDVNGDGKLTPSDALSFMKFSKGMGIGDEAEAFMKKFYKAIPQEMAADVDRMEYTNIDTGFFDSPEYAEFIGDGLGKIGTTDVRYSPYFGEQGSGSIGAEQDAAYEAYLKRTGNESMMVGGEGFVPHQGYQAPVTETLEPRPEDTQTDSILDTTQKVTEPVVQEPEPEPMPTADTSTSPLPEDRPAYTSTAQYTPTTTTSNNIYGTYQTASQTGGLGSTPSGTPGFNTDYIPGAVQPTIQQPTAITSTGSQTVMYQNQFGQRIPVTLVNGQPVTYVPQGYTRMAQGGDVGDTNLEAEYRLATKFLGYQGPKSRPALNDFIKANPGAAARMGKYQQAMAGMARGGVVYAADGVDTGSTDNTTNDTTGAEGSPGFGYYTSVVPMFGNAVSQTMQPMQGMVSYLSPESNQFIGAGYGQVGATSPYAQAATVGTTAQAQMPQYQQAMGYNAYGISPYVQQQTAGLSPAYMQAMDPRTGQLMSQYAVDAAQGQSSLNIQAAQGQAYMMQNPMQRELQQGELISGAADAQKAAAFTEQIEAATAEPSEKATVAGQLEGLMQQFESGDTPAWAAGAMRAAMGQMAARGLGASSLAGQAVVQAAMESAIPIAQADAATVARFESQNLSNRQQRAMLAAQQRAQFMGQEFDQAFQSRVMNASKISDIANMNFTAEQQVALENSRAANTMELANLSNRQAGIMAEAAAIAQMDMANLSSRQQAAVQNAQTFLQIDMANMDRQQQTALFKAQQNIQALFTDQAAENAARQFNSSSENQTRQFFASLANQTSQFNAAQTNATNQFNVSSVNAIREFNANLQQQRDMFNAQNSLVVAQANAQWRQNIATLNTAAQNESNREFASAINGMTAANLDAVWQRERDLMSYNFTSTESAKDRALQIIIADKEMTALKTKLGYQEDADKTELAFRFLFGSSFGGLFGK